MPYLQRTVVDKDKERRDTHELYAPSCLCPRRYLTGLKQMHVLHEYNSSTILKYHASTPTFALPLTYQRTIAVGYHPTTTGPPSAPFPPNA